jgi:hypothetical protein
MCYRTRGSRHARNSQLNIDGNIPAAESNRKGVDLCRTKVFSCPCTCVSLQAACEGKVLCPCKCFFVSMQVCVTASSMRRQDLVLMQICFHSKQQAKPVLCACLVHPGKHVRDKTARIMRMHLYRPRHAAWAATRQRPNEPASAVIWDHQTELLPGTTFLQGVVPAQSLMPVVRSQNILV